MRTQTTDKILESCCKAAQAIDWEIEGEEFALQATLSRFIDIFKAAAQGKYIDPDKLREAVTITHHLTSTDLALIMTEFPASQKGFWELKIAANQFDI